MWQLIVFMIGFGFTCVGGVSIIGYLNFLPVGMNLTDFFLFIYNRPESYLLPLGLLMLIFSMYKNPFQS